MADDDLFHGKKRDPGGPKTFWLKTDTLEKLKAIQLHAVDSDRVIQEIKRAIEARVEELFSKIE